MWLWSRSSLSSENEVLVTVATCLRRLPTDDEFRGERLWKGVLLYIVGDAT